MTSVRCPSCDAAVPADASWCSLCFASLRAGEPSAVPAAPAAPALAAPLASRAVVAPVAPVTRPAAPTAQMLLAPVPGGDPWIAAAISEAPPAPAAAVLPPPAPLAPAPLPTAPLPPAPPAPAPVASAPAAVATVAAPTWPCTACGTLVGFTESACPNCTTPFMGGASPDISLKVPGVGDLVHMSSGAKFGVMAGGAATLAGALVLLFLILGHIF